MNGIKKMAVGLSLFMVLAFTGCNSSANTDISSAETVHAGAAETGEVTPDIILSTQTPAVVPTPDGSSQSKNTGNSPKNTDKKKTGNAVTVASSITPVPAKPGKTLTPAKVTLTIRCDKAVANWNNLREEVQDERIVPKSGAILQTTYADLVNGDTVFSLLARTCKKYGIQMEYEGMSGNAYVKGINNLYQFDCGSLSGWMFSVNGKYADTGSSVYKIHSGDKIVWAFTCDLGRDLK